MRNYLHVGKKNDITKKSVFLVFLSVICNKALKSRTITLHENKTHFYEEVFFNLLYTKLLKRMQNKLYEETE